MKKKSFKLEFEPENLFITNDKPGIRAKTNSLYITLELKTKELQLNIIKTAD